MRAFIPLLLLAASAQAADFFPLQTGNRWTYRSPRGEALTIEVGTPVYVNERTYFSVRGYGAVRMYLRRSDEGALYALDADTREESMVASFGGDLRVPYPVKWSGCEQMAEAEERPVIFDGPLGHFENGRGIRYFAGACRDAGLEQEVYLENVGLARRTVSTIAGPVIYDLVSARVGKLVLETSPHATVTLRLEEVGFAKGPLVLRGELKLAMEGAGPVSLRFSTSQRYDLALRDEFGREVYRWSEGKFFAQQEAGWVVDGEFRVAVEAEVPELPEGRYLLEVWLTAAGQQAPCAIASIEVRPAVK